MLDNCEHLLDAAPDLAALLSGCPRLHVLATSRAPLHIQGEQELAVAPFALPHADHARREDLLNSDAVTLFLQRARAVNHTFDPDEDELRDIVALCRRLDGLPLAIELAAARIKLLPPRALLAHLPQQRHLLSSARRDVPERQRTLGATLSWSYDLLRPSEQRLLRRLGVFVGGFTLEAAAAVAGFMPEQEERASFRLVDSLAALVDHSLIQRIEQPDGEPRWGMLETVREFAVERLEASGEGEEIRRLHADWCLELAEWTADAAWQPTMRTRLRRMAEDVDNVRAALSWSYGGADPALGIQLAVATAIFWTIRGPLAEGRTWLDRALALTPPGEMPIKRARVCYAAGLVISRQQDEVRAEELFSESSELYRLCGNRNGEAESLFFLALAQHEQHARGDPRGTTALFSQVVKLCREVDHPLLGSALANIGLVAHKCGDDARALCSLHEAAALLQERGDQWGYALSQDFLAQLALDRGEAKQAAALAVAALRISNNEGDRISVLEEVFNLACAAAMLGQCEAAGRLVGAVDRHFEMLGIYPDPNFEANRERAKSTVRRTLGKERTAVLVLAGQTMPFDQTIEEALALADAISGTSDSRLSAGPIAGLSAREQEVLRLIAAGRTNAEIADALSIAPRTASTHASHILNKLGLETRTELIAFAHREGVA